MICLDTNVVIGAMSGRVPRLAARLDAELAKGSRILLPAVALFELRYGIAKSARPDSNAAILDAFLAAPIEVAPFVAGDAEEAGKIRAELEATGIPIGHFDVLIAGQARSRGALLVTANRREFDRVPGLAIADWTT